MKVSHFSIVRSPSIIHFRESSVHFKVACSYNSAFSSFNCLISHSIFYLWSSDCLCSLISISFVIFPYNSFIVSLYSYSLIVYSSFRLLIMRRYCLFSSSYNGSECWLVLSFVCSTLSALTLSIYCSIVKSFSFS